MSEEGQVESKNARRGRKVGLVAGITAVCVVLAGVGAWTVHNFTKDVDRKGGMNNAYEVQPYPSQPEAAWTLTFDDIVAAAQQVTPEIDKDMATTMWEAYGDLALVSVDAMGTEESLSARLAVDMKTGKILWALDESKIFPDESEALCGLYSETVVTCVDDAQRKVAWIDTSTGVATPVEGNWSQVVDGVVLEFTETSGGQVSISATRGNTQLWELPVELPAEYAQFTAKTPEELATWSRPLSAYKADAGSDLATVAFSKEGACDASDEEGGVAPGAVCASETDRYYVGLNLETGKVRYAGPYVPVAEVGNELIVQDESKTQTHMSDEGFETNDLTAVVLNANGETTGTFTVDGLATSSLTGVFTVDGSRVAVFGGKNVSLYEAGKWDQPAWTVAAETGDYGSNYGVLQQQTVVVFTRRSSGYEEEETSVVGYDIRNGAERWRQDARLLGADGDSIFLSSDLARNLSAVAPDTGQELWSFKSDGSVTRYGAWLLSCDWQKNCSGLKSP